MQAPEVFAGARARRVSRAEYARMAELDFFRGERVELIHGIIVRMAPIGPPHAEVVDRLTAIFVRALGARARVRIQQPLVASDDSEPEPDVAVVPARSYAAGHPDQALLVIEVAETSLDYDRTTKAALYASSSVSEYWIVDLAGQCVEVFGEPLEGHYTRTRRVAGVDELSPASFPDIMVRVSDLFS